MSTPFSPGDRPSLWEARLAEVMRENFEAKTLEVPAFAGIERFQQQLLRRPDRRQRAGECLAARRRDAHEPDAPVGARGRTRKPAPRLEPADHASDRGAIVADQLAQACLIDTRLVRDRREGRELDRRHVESDTGEEELDRNLLQPAEDMAWHVVDDQIARPRIGVADVPAIDAGALRRIQARHFSTVQPYTPSSAS